MRTLVLGGIRSGKSQWAERALAASTAADEPVHYIATGIATGATDRTDPSWTARVATHAARRPAHWATVETASVATQLRAAPVATLVDDMGGWLTAACDRHRVWDHDDRDGLAGDADMLVDAVRDFTSPLMLVSPEVGLSVVPATRAGALFADELGLLNQRLADVCDRVVLVVAGQPVDVKGRQQ